MLRRNEIIILLALFSTGLTLFPAIPGAEEIPHIFNVPNGITARIYGPEVIMETMTLRDGNGRLVFEAPGGLSYVLVEIFLIRSYATRGTGVFIL